MLPIITHPAPRLRERSQEISPADTATLSPLIDDMITTMYQDDGIGLAAPQVGQNIRLFVVGKEALKHFRVLEGTLNPKQDLALINPVWEKTSRKTEWDVEGCLSVPNTFGKVKRNRDIRVRAFDRSGKTIAFEAHQFLARVIQHETDHIDGILFIDKAKDIYTVNKKL